MKLAGRFALSLVAFSVLLGGSIAGAAKPAEKKCDRCGIATCDLRKCCKPVPVEIEKKEVCYDCKCEDFCVPGRSILCETKCHEDDCGCWVENVWKPTCAEVRTRNVMVKKEVTRKSQGFKWEMQNLCCACQNLPPASKGTPPSGKKQEEVEEERPEDQSVEEVEISSTAPAGPPAAPVAARPTPTPAPRRSLLSFLR